MIDLTWEYDELESSSVTQSHDSDLVGDPMQEAIAEDITRLYIQNLNGLNWNKDGGKWQYVCDVIETIQADICCFSELNTNTNKYDIRHQMESMCQQRFPQNCLVLASSKHDTSTAYKPGGTAILARNAITACITSHTRDRMGRWASIRITTGSARKIRIISAYQVCHSTSNGANTAAAQQRTQLIEEAAALPTIRRFTPRQAFIQELQSFLLQVQNEHEEIILAGDFNEEITKLDSGMQSLATRCGLVDLFSVRLGTADQPATYQRGRSRLDYILISPSLLPHIKAAGYDPFGYRIPSDHRGMYVDFDTDSLLQQDLFPLAAPERREFKTTSPGVLQKYISAKMTYLNDHHFFERLTSLEKLGTPDHALAESLDRDFQRSSVHAARKCSKKPRPPWSPKLAQAWAELHYYKLAKSSLDTTAKFHAAISRLQQQWPDLPTPVSTDRTVIQQGIRQALLALKHARQSAQTLREEFLMKQFAQYKEKEDKSRARILRRLLRAESQHKVYQKIQKLRHPDGGSFSLSSIKIPRNLSISDTSALKQLPDTPEHWETITLPEEIERILLHRNQLHFGQAEGTPFTKPPLQVDIGYKAEGYAADLILAGQASYANLSHATSLLIKHLQARTVEVLEGQVTTNDVRNKLSKWKESTTTSPSGLHLGHYHATWRDPHVPGEEGVAVRFQQEQLLRATTSLLNYAIKFGYTYHRWTKVVNIMLQKDPGNPRIHRLRVIHIYEADYNMLLAIKWRQALHFAEDRKLLNDGMYGSRPGRTAHEPALIEVLQHETYRMSMKSGINFDLDASSCYDRILASVAAICSRRIGMSAKVVQMNVSTLYQARYHLKTKLGTSQGSYSHSVSHPIHGTGQGSGNSPSIWCFVCSALFDALESSAHGATFTNYNKSITIPMHMIGFVDDCTQRVNRFDDDIQPTATQLIQTMERDVQLWNDLLWASGGALEQSKCSYHIVQSDWTPDGQPFLKGGTENTPIQLSHAGIMTTTLQKSNYTAHKTLGCHINPAFSTNQPWTATSIKNESLSQLLETNYFTRSESWTFYTSIYLPSLTYPLPITPLTKQQCSTLDARFLRTILPRCGYNRNMSRAIRYAPFHMGGAGFKPLYIVQGSLMLQHLYKHLNSPETTVGKMLMITISWTQAFLGVSSPFLQNVHCKLPPTGPSWLLAVRNFLQEIDGSVHINDPPVPPLLRVHDRFIMDIVVSQQCWSKQQIIQINSCRRYLQAQTLADITNIQGTRLSQNTRNCVRPPTSALLRQSLFNQSRPSQKAWHTWNKFLDTMTKSYGILHQPLGHWTRSITCVRYWPKTVYNPETDELFSHHDGPYYLVHDRIFHGTFSIRPSTRQTEAIGYPTSTVITMDTLRPVHDYIQHTSYDKHTLDLRVGPSIQVDLWEYNLLRYCRNMVPESVIIDNIKQGQLLSCSDGSATDSAGSFGFVISTITGQRLTKGKGAVHGSFHNSFRSEAYGVLATVRWLYRTTTWIGPAQGIKITHYLDNRSVIKRIESTLSPVGRFPNQRLLPEQDIIDEIVATISCLPVAIELKWVKGHQDRGTSLYHLSLPAQLNCEADYEADQFHPSDEENYAVIPPLPHTPGQLILQQKFITSHIKRRTQDAFSLPLISKYTIHKFQWEDNTYNTIDWKLFSQIITKYQDTWTTLVKHLYNISPTGAIAHRNNAHLPHECPACLQPHEDNSHLLTCPHPSRSAWRQITIAKLVQYGEERVDPCLLDILRDGLTRLHRQLEPIDQQSYPARYSTLIRTQNAIGWIQLYRARWSKEWSSLQDEYNSRHHNDTATRIPGPSWVLGAGRLLIDQWLQLWKLRNDQRHGRDNDNHNQVREQAITSELQELYSYRDRVCPADRSLFYDSVTTHLQRHTKLEILEDWILNTRPAIMASAQQAQRLGVQRNRTLLEYPMFNPIARASERPSLAAGPSTD